MERWCSLDSLAALTSALGFDLCGRVLTICKEALQAERGAAVGISFPFASGSGPRAAGAPSLTRDRSEHLFAPLAEARQVVDSGSGFGVVEAAVLGGTCR